MENIQELITVKMESNPSLAFDEKFIKKIRFEIDKLTEEEVRVWLKIIDQTIAFLRSLPGQYAKEIMNSYLKIKKLFYV